jgi:hypothetical protein
MVNALKHDFTLLVQLEAPAAATGQPLAASYGLLEAPAADSPSGEYAAALVLYPKELFPAAATDKAAATATAAVDEDETEDEDETAAATAEEEKKPAGAHLSRCVHVRVRSRANLVCVVCRVRVSCACAVVRVVSCRVNGTTTAQKKEKPSITELRLDWGDLPAKEQIKNTAIPSSIFFSHGVLFLYSVLPHDAIPQGQVPPPQPHTHRTHTAHTAHAAQWWWVACRKRSR